MVGAEEGDERTQEAERKREWNRVIEADALKKTACRGYDEGGDDGVTVVRDSRPLFERLQEERAKVAARRAKEEEDEAKGSFRGHSAVLSPEDIEYLDGIERRRLAMLEEERCADIAIRDAFREAQARALAASSGSGAGDAGGVHVDDRSIRVIIEAPSSSTTAKEGDSQSAIEKKRRFLGIAPRRRKREREDGGGTE